MKCCVCGAIKDLVRLNCGDGMHKLCVTCNNSRYNTPMRDSAGREIPGTHNRACPICNSESVEPVYRAMVSYEIKRLLAAQVGITIDRYEFSSKRPQD